MKKLLLFAVIFAAILFMAQEKPKVQKVPNTLYDSTATYKLRQQNIKLDSLINKLDTNKYKKR